MAPTIPQRHNHLTDRDGHTTDGNGQARTRQSYLSRHGHDNGHTIDMDSWSFVAEGFDRVEGCRAQGRIEAGIHKGVSPSGLTGRVG